MLVTAKKIKLVMFEKTDMPGSVYDQTQKKYVKDGTTTEKTTYTFRDEMGEKLVFLGGNDYRKLEGKDCDLQIDISYNGFERKNKVSLKSVIESK